MRHEYLNPKTDKKAQALPRWRMDLIASSASRRALSSSSRQPARKDSHDRVLESPAPPEHIVEPPDGGDACEESHWRRVDSRRGTPFPDRSGVHGEKSAPTSPQKDAANSDCQALKDAGQEPRLPWMHRPGTLTPEVDNPSPRRRSHTSQAFRRETLELDPEAERSSHEEPRDLRETDDKRMSVESTRSSDEEATSFEIYVIDRITERGDRFRRKKKLSRTVLSHT